MPTKCPAVVVPGTSPAQRLHEPEVGQVGVLLVALAGEQDVAGLDVAVDEAAAVGGVERGGDLADDPDRARGRERALAGDGVQQVGAVDEAHGDVELAVDLPRLVDGDHVRVIDRGGEHRLALEALAELAVAREVLGDQLQRDGALERDLSRAIDDAHATLAGDAVDLVAREDGACGQIGDAHLYPGDARAGDSFPRDVNVLPTAPYARGGGARGGGPWQPAPRGPCGRSRGG